MYQYVSLKHTDVSIQVSDENQHGTVKRVTDTKWLKQKGQNYDLT